MKKILIVLMFIMLGSAIIIISNTNNDLETSYVVEYQNNKNLALPDLNGKTEISSGVYRLYNGNGITVDYNITNGFWIMNGQPTSIINLHLSNKVTTGILTATLEVISNQPSTSGAGGWTFGDTSTAEGRIYFSSLYPPFTRTFNKTLSLDDIRFFIATNYNFNNFTFKLQLEKGSTATPYVVPRLVPIYKDNLSYKEKQEIGMGAFNGITQILRTIGNVIEPIGDFFNGLFSLFN